MLVPGTQIALFPLNLVLFPGMMLPLHIFEPRYKAMVKRCIDSNRTFGVVLAKSNRAQKPNVATLYQDDLYPVGTTAHINGVENLQDGRMNLITVGQERFIITEIEASQADFLIGHVNPLSISDEAPLQTQGLTQKLRPLLQKYLEQLSDASGEDLSNASLPMDPATLAYFAGMAIQSPLTDKQQLLSANSVRSLVTRAMTVLDRENKILAYMLRAYNAHQQVPRLPFVDYSFN